MSSRARNVRKLQKIYIPRELKTKSADIINLYEQGIITNIKTAYNLLDKLVSSERPNLTWKSIKNKLNTMTEAKTTYYQVNTILFKYSIHSQ